MTDHYKTLDLPRDADTPAIIRAWRLAASIYHPDKPTGDADKFRAAREAFNVLADREDRAKHDAELNGHADAGLLTEDDFAAASEVANQLDEIGGIRKPGGDCMMCGNSREVRVAAAGFWTRRRCPACSA